MISIIQNFICTQPQRLKLLKQEVPNMGNIFKNSEFYINYNSSVNLNEVYQTYNNNISKLNFTCISQNLYLAVSARHLSCIGLKSGSSRNNHTSAMSV